MTKQDICKELVRRDKIRVENLACLIEYVRITDIAFESKMIGKPIRIKAKKLIKQQTENL